MLKEFEMKLKTYKFTNVFDILSLGGEMAESCLLLSVIRCESY